MENQLVYVELKSGYDEDGPAWIGKASHSKSGRTLYFNGKAFKSARGHGVQGNYIDVETGDEYWISGVKKNQQDRHWVGTGPVMIDEPVVPEYLALIGASRLDKNKYEIVWLDHGDVASRLHERQNKP